MRDKDIQFLHENQERAGQPEVIATYDHLKETPHSSEESILLETTAKRSSKRRTKNFANTTGNKKIKAIKREKREIEINR